MKIKKYYIITIGCQMNKSDSERFAGYLDCLGYRRVSKPAEADLAVLVTCGIRQSAEDRVYGLIPAIKKKNPKIKIILTGCLSERKDVIKRLKGEVDIFLPIAKLPILGEILGEKKLKIEKKDYLKIQPNYNSSFSAFVPIGNGCNNFCAYCVVPYARGREAYRPVADILKEIKNLVARGYKEIILIAQNVNSYYGLYKGKKIDFADLLLLVNDIKGDFWIRFATSHPKDMSGKLIGVIKKGKKICQHIHLPAQAGDNKILKAMNRKYTRQDYLKLIQKIRQKLPDVSLTTDIIVGFPGETKKQFKNTARLFIEVGFDMAYIARYSPRPGTAAFKLTDNVSQKEKKDREEELTEILRQTALASNKKYLGGKYQILVEAVNKNGLLIGKTGTNKVVRAKLANKKIKPEAYIGKFAKVAVESVFDFGLSGKLIDF